MLTEVAKYNCRYSSPGASSTFDSTRWNAAKWSSRMLPVLKTTNSYASRHHNVSHCHPLAVRQSLLCVWAHIYIWQFQKRHGVSIATSESRVRYRRWPHSTREASICNGRVSVRPSVRVFVRSIDSRYAAATFLLAKSETAKEFLTLSVTFRPHLVNRIDAVGLCYITLRTFRVLCVCQCVE